MRTRLLPSALIALLLVGCASVEGTGTGSNDGGADVGFDARELGIDADASDADGSGDADAGDADVGLAAGEFGDPCNSGDDCLAGICIEAVEGGLICTQFCTDDCPDDAYECRLIENSGGDLVNICYPIFDDLCRDCEFDRQCGGLADRCVTLLDGQYCAKDCTADGICPEDYVCNEFPDGARQCVPEVRQCTGCVDIDGDAHGEGPGCLGLDCDEDNAATYEGAPELCDGLDNDCDIDIDEGFDFDTNAEHCGGCGQTCEIDHAEPGCSGGTCFILTCDPQYYDLNGLRADGCEYFCEFEDFEIEDRPDSDFRDTNCDGIDGDPNRAIFVAPSGDDGDPGTMDSPVRTLRTAMSLVVDMDFVDSVYAAEGAYFGLDDGDGGFLPIALVDGVHVYGGYEAGPWRRSRDNITRIAASSPAAVIDGFTAPTELGLIEFEGADARTRPDGIGRAAIGLLVRASTDVLLTGCTVLGGVGGDGRPGDPGRDGFVGGDGGQGGLGEVDSSGLCSSNPAPARGSVGASPCENPGGLGGQGSRSESDGRSGDNGTGPAGGGGGPGGNGGNEDWTTAVDDPGEPGGAGGNGGNGDPGGGGAPGASAGTLDDQDIWTPGAGGEGLDGLNGSGGGGGGGGGGAPGGCGGFTDTCDGYGGSGGGGGGGGCGGTGGTGGHAGGGSYALYVVDSSVRVSGGRISGGNGGRGGDGGDGGPGGNGGGPGLGGGTSCAGGTGGNGGRGGDGGRGGRGGGGGGGSSYAIVTVRSPAVVAEGAVLQFGVVGPGGDGGNPGEEGARGEIQPHD